MEDSPPPSPPSPPGAVPPPPGPAPPLPAPTPPPTTATPSPSASALPPVAPLAPGEATATVVSITATMGGTVESFNAVADVYKAALAELLAIQLEYIELIVSAASVNVEARITPPPSLSVGAVAAELDGATQAAARTAGLQVEAITPPSVRLIVVHAGPRPSPPPPLDSTGSSALSGGDQGPSSAMLAGIGVGAVLLLALIACCLVRARHQKKSGRFQTADLNMTGSSRESSMCSSRESSMASPKTSSKTPASEVLKARVTEFSRRRFRKMHDQKPIMKAVRVEMAGRAPVAGHCPSDKRGGKGGSGKGGGGMGGMGGGFDVSSVSAVSSAGGGYELPGYDGLRSEKL